MENEKNKKSFVCEICWTLFTEAEIQKAHFKSDWHYYNIGRRSMKLSPITIDDFQKVFSSTFLRKDQQEQYLNCQRYEPVKSENQQQNQLISEESKTPKDSENFKNFVDSKYPLENSENARSAKNSKNFRNLKNLDEDFTDDENDTQWIAISNLKEQILDIDIELLNMDEWIVDKKNPVGKNYCLFCDYQSISLADNLKHMTIKHSFLLPDLEYCVDIKGLLVHLGHKIFSEYICIWCNLDADELFDNADAVRTHMLQTGHCKMLHEGDALIEYAEFYNYFSSFPDTYVDKIFPDAYSNKVVLLPSGNFVKRGSLMRYYKSSLNPNGVFVLSKAEKLREILLKQRSLYTKSNERAMKTAAGKRVRDLRYMQKIQDKYFGHFKKDKKQICHKINF